MPRNALLKTCLAQCGELWCNRQTSLKQSNIVKGDRVACMLHLRALCWLGADGVEPHHPRAAAQPWAAV